MEFDKTKGYTALNADELKVGDKVYVANNLYDLKYDVENEKNLAAIREIYSCDCNKRFMIKFVGSEISNEYSLAYLVERAKEKKWRPFKDIDELITAWQKKTGVTATANTMPLIWLRDKMCNNKRIVTSFCSPNIVVIRGIYYTMKELFDEYEFLDGTPCGVEE